MTADPINAADIPTSQDCTNSEFSEFLGHSVKEKEFLTNLYVCLIKGVGNTYTYSAANVIRAIKQGARYQGRQTVTGGKPASLPVLTFRLPPPPLLVPSPSKNLTPNHIHLSNTRPRRLPKRILWQLPRRRRRQVPRMRWHHLRVSDPAPGRFRLTFWRVQG